MTLLSVPWQSQLDNKSGTGYRECFSSSCAMVAMYHGAIGSDDEYNDLRSRFGDTTSAQAQLRALRALGLQADFRTDGKPSDLEVLLDRSLPVAVGWLHKGHVSRPSGGGHWSVVRGYSDAHWIHNDPNGEALLVSGGYRAGISSGRGVRYSRQNWDPRWRPGGEGGWFLVVSK